MIDRLRRDLDQLRRLGRGLGALRHVGWDRSGTVADALERQAAERPDHPALVHRSGMDRTDRTGGTDEIWTYRQLDRAANRVARWAETEGLARGDVVALLMENRPEYVVTWLGLAKRGITAALINTNLTGNPLAHSLRVSGARHVIVGAELAERFATARGQLDPAPAVFAQGGAVEGARDLDAAWAGQADGPLPAGVREGLQAADPLFYIYTSGTTGLPKAARFTHLKFLLTAGGFAVLTDVRPEDRVYVCLPLYHSAGGVMALGGALVNGATAAIARRFSVSGFWSDVVHHDATVFQYIGELCRYLLNAEPHPDERRHRLRVCLGNGLRPEVWRPFQERFAIPRIAEFYGATEGNVIFLNLDGKVGAVGRSPALVRKLLGIHLVRFDVEREEVLRGPDGFCIECGPGEVGEAIGRISAVSRFDGYSDEEATERKILRDVFARGDAYFRTGDLLRSDEDDYFYFVDRIGDTFRWKGENVATSEVAEVLSTCPGVREANVYGVEVPGADGRAGMAALVVAEDFDLDRLSARVGAELPAYARPLFLRIRPEMEITGTFKHRKVDLAREGFDPERIEDPLWFLDPGKGAYVPLDRSLHERIAQGQARL